MKAWVTFSTRICLDDKLTGISCKALEELSELCSQSCPEGVTDEPILNQLHDILTLVRAGILHIEHDEHTNGRRILILRASIE